MASLFSKIVAGEIPAHKIAENEHFLAFLDINPLVKGHTLVIPKKEIDYIFDLEEQEYRDLWTFARKVGKRLESKVKCKRIGIAVIGLEVPHAHIHLVPINEVEDINFAAPKLTLSHSELAAIADSIRA